MELRELLADFKALDTNSLAVSSNPRAKTAYGLYNTALLNAKIGKITEARQSLRQAIQVYPDFDDGYLLLGLVIFESGNRIDAMRMFNQITDYQTHNYAMDCFDRLSGVAAIQPVQRKDDEYSLFIDDNAESDEQETSVWKSGYDKTSNSDKDNGGENDHGYDETPAISLYTENRNKTGDGYKQLSLFDDDTYSEFFGTPADNANSNKASGNAKANPGPAKKKKNDVFLYGGRTGENRNGENSDNTGDSKEKRKKDGESNIRNMKKWLLIGASFLIIALIASAIIYSARDKLFKKNQTEETPIPTVSDATPAPEVTEEPEDTSEPQPTGVPASEKIEECRTQYGELRTLYDAGKYHDCVVMITDNNWDYLPEDLVSSFRDIYDKSFSLFADSYYNLMYQNVYPENWDKVLEYGLEIIKYCPDYRNGAVVYFNVGKAYELTGDTESAIYYYNQAISKYPGTSDAGYAEYRLKLLMEKTEG